MSERLDWEGDFKNKFHSSWWPFMKKWIEGEDAFNIYQDLKTYRPKGIKIYPVNEQTWNAFNLVDRDHLKAILVLQSPYHTEIKGVPVADGIPMSCSNTRILQPSLNVFYDAMSDDLGCEVRREPNLEYLCSQNILLLNTSLTVKAQKADSHKELWQPFVDFLFKEVLDTVTGVPIVLFGDTAKKQVEKHLFPLSQPYKVVKHPAYYARTGEKMDHKNIFSWIKKVNKDNNNEELYWDYNDWLDKGLPF